ncbi:hypothetical protein CcI156_19950 [Frankia sp. CcI156]|uniref:hypothetical protein n=1 Tax=Frankia TaxID=1854 RepID=UPI0003D05595|nr:MULTISPECIES: hypothetical protein [Frankia]ETA00418.1 hypothetical protein CcI6DRAFT_04173 [Frankia sp. CcI6]OAA20063.1 hypothetical protein AAY23_109815 [Frankia casuarinae]OHV51107.1 hypothetical protein CgIS1_19555 [Frankia sp. CgIS1]ONH22913.1 hypothetical protein CcI156_19950 [Frankia sp. CcI156]
MANFPVDQLTPLSATDRRRAADIVDRHITQSPTSPLGQARQALADAARNGTEAATVDLAVLRRDALAGLGVALHNLARDAGEFWPWFDVVRDECDARASSSGVGGPTFAETTGVGR